MQLRFPSFIISWVLTESVEHIKYDTFYRKLKDMDKSKEEHMPILVYVVAMYLISSDVVAPIISR